MATASALGEFNSYINKFWGATDIVVTYGTDAPFANQTILTKVQNNPQVAQTAERLDWFGGSKTPSSNATFILSGLDPTNDFDYSSFNMTGTRSFTSSQAVVDNVIAEKLGVGIGSNLNIFTILPTSNQSQIKPLTFSLQIVGINYPLRTLGSAVYMRLPQLQSLLGLEGNVTRIFARLYDPTQALTVQNDLQKQLPSYDVSAPKAEAVQRIHAQTTGFEIGLNVMIGVSLVVCSFIVFNTLFMSVSERTYEIGVIRAIGGSRGQVFRIFLAEGLLIGAIGTIVGIVGGLGFARLITSLVETTFDVPNLPVAQLTLAIALTGLAAGFGAVISGALYPAISASRVNIMQAIRPAARNARRDVPLSLVGMAGVLLVGTGAVESLRLIPFHINYLDVVLVPIGLVLIGSVIYGKAGPAFTLPMSAFSDSVRQVASKSGRRRLLRSSVSFGMIAITLSFAIMIGGIQGGVQGALQQGIQEALGADIILIANQSIPTSFTNSLTSMQNVSTATALSPSQTPAKAFDPSASTSIGVLAVDPLVFPTIISYTFVNTPSVSNAYSELAINNQSMLMPDSLATKLGITTGDNLTVLTDLGNRTFMVAGVFTGPVLQYIQFGEHYASDSIIVSFASQQEFFGGTNTSPLFLVDLKPQFKSQASTVAHEIATTYPQYNFSENSLTLAELLSLVNDTINRIFALILLILYFALLIASLGIGATMVMNVSERRREIGLLRSLGMSRGQITGLFLSEGILLGLFGFLLAVPGGLLLLKGATNSTTLAGFFIPYVVPYGAILQSLILALVAVLAGSLYPALRASRMEITRSLERA